MRLDADIERDVKDELGWDPDFNATDVAVSFKDGVVEFAGFVRSYADRYEAEVAAKRVAGMRGVANDIDARMPNADQRPDPDIARDAAAAIKAQSSLSYDDFTVAIRNGCGMLEGHVEWQYQPATSARKPSASPGRRPE